MSVAQSAGVAEYTEYISAEGEDSPKSVAQSAVAEEYTDCILSRR